jgi:spectinomycin phosphotransferase
MLEEPGLEHTALRQALRDGYGIDARAFTFIPTYDPRAASYEVAADDASFFLKCRLDAIDDASLEVPVALRDAAIPNVLAPIRSRASAAWTPMGELSLVVYPFVRGRSAMEVGLSKRQWHEFGATLRAVHDSGLEDRFAATLPTHTFASVAPAEVRRAREQAGRPPAGSPQAIRLAELLRAEEVRIGAILDRFEELGERLQARAFDRVLCHADIHAANLLVTDDGGILLVDWDGPMLAPRERDLLFVIGSRIARAVEPHEEAWFFAGYGDVEVDPDALVYYRYERVIEDIGEFAKSVFGDEARTEEARRTEVDLVESFFARGDILDTIEVVQRHR